MRTAAYAFDLDGTLIDSHAAVKESYRLAGATLPSNAFELRWQEWCSPEIHAAKSKLYPSVLKTHAKLMPLMQYVVQCNLPVLTGASPEAVAAIESAFSLKLNVVATRLLAIDKAKLLTQISGYGTFVDDTPEVRDVIQRMTSWRVISPEQAAKELLPWQNYKDRWL